MEAQWVSDRLPRVGGINDGLPAFRVHAVQAISRTDIAERELAHPQGLDDPTISDRQYAQAAFSADLGPQEAGRCRRCRRFGRRPQSHKLRPDPGHRAPDRNAIAQEESSAEKTWLLRSIPGIGPVSATMLIAEMPELGRMTAGEAAAMTGLAPVPRDSGTRRGRRTIGGRCDRRCSRLRSPTPVTIKC